MVQNTYTRKHTNYSIYHHVQSRKQLSLSSLSRRKGEESAPDEAITHVAHPNQQEEQGSGRKSSSDRPDKSCLEVIAREKEGPSKGTSQKYTDDGSCSRTEFEVLTNLCKLDKMNNSSIEPTGDHQPYGLSVLLFFPEFKFP